MKKSIISLCGLLFFAAQSCDVLDKDPVEFVSTEETFANCHRRNAAILLQQFLSRLA